MTVTATLTSVRKKLGYQKWYWFQGGRANVEYDRMIARLDQEAGRDLTLLKPLPVVNGLPIECHMYCGHKQIAMGTWAWWSFLRFAREHVTPVMHSDGSLNADDKALLQRLFPGMIVKDKSYSAGIIENQIPAAKFPHLHDLSKRYVLGARLASFHLGSTAQKIMILDSDILFFRYPDELIEQMHKDSPAIVAMADIKPAYAAPYDEMSRVMGFPIPDLVNGGLCVIPRYTPEMIEWIEWALNTMPREWRENYFLEQTLLAIVAGKVGIHLLSDQYRIPTYRSNTDSLCYHYVGGKNIRPRLYTEGVQLLKKQAQQS